MKNSFFFKELDRPELIFRCRRGASIGCLIDAVGWFYAHSNIYGYCQAHIEEARSMWNIRYPKDTREITQCAINQLLAAHQDNQRKIGAIIQDDARYIKKEYNVIPY